MIRSGIFWWGDDADFGNPCFGWEHIWSLRGGFYGDYVYNRHLTGKGTVKPDIGGGKLSTNAAFLALNLLDRFDLFTTLGATHFFVNSTSSFSWSLGARAVIWQWNCLFIGLEGQYFQSRANASKISNFGALSPYLTHSIDFHYWEAQAGLAAAYRFNHLIPYAGVKWSRVQLSLDPIAIPIGFELPSFENEKQWGFALGTTFLACDFIDATVAGRWGDESALFINCEIRF